MVEKSRSNGCSLEAQRRELNGKSYTDNHRKTVTGKEILISIETLQPITHIPHEKEYRAWRAKLTDEQYHSIECGIEDRLGDGEVQTAGWIPGNDWSDTPFDPIYSVACEGDHVASGLFFGLIVWVFMQQRPEAWSFGRYEKDGVPIRSLTYFRVTLK